MFSSVENTNGSLILLNGKGSIFAIISLLLSFKSFLILLRHSAKVSRNFWPSYTLGSHLITGLL